MAATETQARVIIEGGYGILTDSYVQRENVMMIVSIDPIDGTRILDLYTNDGSGNGTGFLRIELT